MILIVTLDLRGPATSYDRLYEELKNLGSWWHYMRWTWLLDTVHSPNEIVGALMPHVQKNDRMLVTRLTRPYQGMLVEKEWDWITTRMAQNG